MMLSLWTCIGWADVPSLTVVDGVMSVKFAMPSKAMQNAVIVQHVAE